MKTANTIDPTRTAFVQSVASALTALKSRLQLEYERAYPQLREIVRLVVEQEEARAWSLSAFPHLIFPDLVDSHIRKLSLQPPKTVPHVVAPGRFRQIALPHPVFAHAG